MRSQIVYEKRTKDKGKHDDGSHARASRNNKLFINWKGRMQKSSQTHRWNLYNSINKRLSFNYMVKKWNRIHPHALYIYTLRSPLIAEASIANRMRNSIKLLRYDQNYSTYRMKSGQFLLEEMYEIYVRCMSLSNAFRLPFSVRAHEWPLCLVSFLLANLFIQVPFYNRLQAWTKSSRFFGLATRFAILTLYLVTAARMYNDALPETLNIIYVHLKGS